jgi:hypothetical protein
MGRSALIAVIAAALWGCPSGGSTSTTPRPDGGPICGVGPADIAVYPACAAGTRCNNRTCAPTCAAGCPPGMYCEGPPPEDVCALVNPIVCAKNTDCPAPQGCLFGLCASAELRADGGYQGCVLSEPDDACGPDAICYSLANSNGTISNTCVGLPACSQGGACPPGTYGAICNEGRNPDGGPLLAGKQRICLFSYCMQDTDCNVAAHCFFGAPALLGRCNFGRAGDGCFSNADCIGSTGCSGADGGLLDGGTPGACH